MSKAKSHAPRTGSQRLCVDALHRWESLRYGMFIHFGMSTYDGDEFSMGDKPSTTYAPANLDVDQWIAVARDAGMKYAVLTAKHTAGHCLWPSRHTEYHVGTSGNPTDVVEAFVLACEKHHVLPGLYYCSLDNHHTLGSITWRMNKSAAPFTTAAYREFQFKQVDELLTQYGPIAEVWIDIPNVLGHEGRRQQYDQIARLQPDAVIMMNSGTGNGTRLDCDYAWPTDLMAIERNLPTSHRGYNPWHTIEMIRGEPKDFYVPGEVCDPIGYEWFYVDNDRPRPSAELLGMRLICEARNVNLLLDVPPDRSGRIPRTTVDALMTLQKDHERFTA